MEEEKMLVDQSVHTDDGLEYYLHHLIAVDVTPVNKDTDIQSNAEASVQHFINKLFQLPREASEDGVAVKLPLEPMVCNLKFPRSLPLPSAHAETRWEKFAKEKHIVKAKRSRLVWDNTTKEWVPRWGKGGIQSIRKKSQIIIEEKGGIVRGTKGKRKTTIGGHLNTLPGTKIDAASDPFSKLDKDKDLAKSKQKLREYRNMAEAEKGKEHTREMMRGGKSQDSSLPAGVPVLQSGIQHRKKSKTELKEVLQRAQFATASFGQHDKRVRDEQPLKQSKKQRTPINAPSARAETDMYQKQLKLLIAKKTSKPDE